MSMNIPENTLTLRNNSTHCRYDAIGSLDYCRTEVWSPKTGPGRVHVEIAMTTLVMTAPAALELGKHLQAAATVMMQGGDA